MLDDPQYKKGSYGMENVSILKDCAWKCLERTICVFLTEDCATILLMKKETIFNAYQYERRANRDC